MICIWVLPLSVDGAGCFGGSNCKRKMFLPIWFNSLSSSDFSPWSPAIGLLTADDTFRLPWTTSWYTGMAWGNEESSKFLVIIKLESARLGFKLTS